MKKIVRAYYYLFYKLYKWIGEENGWADWKAGLAVMAFEIWFLLSIGSYFSFFTKKATELSFTTPIVLIPFLCIFIINYLMFIHTNIWKEYVKEFDLLPKRKNNIGGAIVFAVLLFIVGNLIFSFYLMSQVDWAQYR